MRPLRIAIAGVLSAAAAACGETLDSAVPGLPVTHERLVKSAQEPANWLMYSGQFNGQRFSALDRINRANVHKLRLSWVYQLGRAAVAETTPLVVNGVMYVTRPVGDVIALDARTGREFWAYQYERPKKLTLCCGANVRGAAVLGDRVFVGTLDAKLIALDAHSGHVLWTAEVAKASEGYSITGAPLAVKDRIIVGVGGGEFGIRGFVDAYDAATGRRLWRTYTIPGPGEPGNETWKGDSWKTGGAPTWMTGSYDPELNLVYWGTGNPGPDFAWKQRLGDNLCSDCVLAINPDNGAIKWHFQFTPGDKWDWDATQVPILIDREFGGRQRKLLVTANRNAFYYVLDRETGEFLWATPFAKQTWAERIDAKGRPVFRPGIEPNEQGVTVAPAVVGGTNWYPPAYSPQTGLFYIKSFDAMNVYRTSEPAARVVGEIFFGSAAQAVPVGDTAVTALRALDATTGALRWEYRMRTPEWTRQDRDDAQYNSQPGVLATAGGLVVSATREGEVIALDAGTGALLWHFTVGGTILAAPMTWMIDGKQFLTIAAGNALFTFGLD